MLRTRGAETPYTRSPKIAGSPRVVGGGLYYPCIIVTIPSRDPTDSTLYLEGGGVLLSRQRNVGDYKDPRKQTIKGPLFPQTYPVTSSYRLSTSRCNPEPDLNSRLQLPWQKCPPKDPRLCHPEETTSQGWRRVTMPSYSVMSYHRKARLCTFYVSVTGKVPGTVRVLL